MADTKRVLRSTFSALLIGATILGLVNVYGDNSDVKRLAERTACGNEDCSVTMTQMELNPFSQSFTLQTQVRNKRQPAQTVHVKCRRSAWLLGDYSCSTDAAP